MKVAVEILGAGPASLLLVRASTNSGAGNCLNLESRRCPVHNIDGEGFEKLLLVIGGNINMFEGCCCVASNYYALWPKAKAANDYGMLQALGSGGVTQQWCYFDLDLQEYVACNQANSSPPIP